MNVALFGGSFDPPHVGHVFAATYALSILDVEEVLVVPVFAHPFEKELAPFVHRFEMAKRAFAPVAHASVSNVEETLGAPSLTIRTLEHLRAEHPDWRIHLVVGSDVLSEASKWVAWDQIERYARLVVLGRESAPHPDAPKAVLPDISSTRIRGLLRRRDGDSAGAEELARSVPRRVLEYIDAHGLYE